MASFQLTVDSFVLFQFQDLRTLKLLGYFSVLFQCFYFRDVQVPEIKPKIFCFSRPPAALFNCSFIPDVRTSLEQDTETV